MANKYIIHGATINGDGTAATEALTPGGVGAWNTITYFEGTAPAFGSLAAGDTVYIRSKTSAGADITRAMSGAVSLGSASGTAAAPIVWIVDAGTVWSGVTGTLTYQASAGTHTTTVLANNIIDQGVQGQLVFLCTLATTTSITGGLLVIQAGAVLRKPKIDTTARTSTSPITSTRVYGVLDSPLFKAGKIGNNSNCLIRFDSDVRGVVINPDIELQATPTAGMAVFYALDAFGTIVGGRIYGSGATTGQELARFNATNAKLTAMGLIYPKTMTAVDPTGAAQTFEFQAIGADGEGGGVFANAYGIADSRDDGNYPTLNAYLPGSAAPWSWKIYPRAATLVDPFYLASAKVFVDTAASKTITAELLLSDEFAGLNKSNVWIEGCYVDNSTGVPTAFGTRDYAGAALDTSTAAWSAASYGAVSLLKRKLAVTTPTAIKPNTLITLRLCVAKTSASDNDILFFDPDFTLS